MEDYHFHCFQAFWETKPFLKAGLQAVHGPSHTFTLSAPSESQWPPRQARHDNDTTVGEHGHHFFDACGRCGQLLGRNKDIFMYRGDTPFCSECRQQEMDADKAANKGGGGSSRRPPAR